jgi:hypothetical protein
MSKEFKEDIKPFAILTFVIGLAIIYFKRSQGSDIGVALGTLDCFFVTGSLFGLTWFISFIVYSFGGKFQSFFQFLIYSLYLCLIYYIAYKKFK